MQNENQRITFKYAARNWWKWVSWSLFFIVIAELIFPMLYGIVRDAWIADLNQTADSFETYLASTDQSVGVFYDIIKDMFLFGVIGYFGNAVATKNKQRTVGAIRNIWISVIIVMLASSVVIETFMLFHIDNGSFAQNIDESGDPIAISNKDEWIDRATMNYSILIWTQIFRLIVAINFLMIAIVNKKAWTLVVLIVIRESTQVSFDLLLFVPNVSPFELGSIGVAASELITQIVTMIVSIVFVYYVVSFNQKDFRAARKVDNKSQLWNNAGWSGGESLVRNAAFFLVFLTTLSYLSADAYTAWSYASGVFWGLLLIPQVAIQQTLARDISSGVDATVTRAKSMYIGHFFIGFILIFWLIFFPFADEYLYWQTNGSINTEIYELSIKGFYILMLPMFVYSLGCMWMIYFYSTQQIKTLFYITLCTTITIWGPTYLINLFNPLIINFEVVIWIFSFSLIANYLFITGFWIIYFKRFNQSSNIKDEITEFELVYVHKSRLADDKMDPLNSKAKYYFACNDIKLFAFKLEWKKNHSKSREEFINSKQYSDFERYQKIFIDSVKELEKTLNEKIESDAQIQLFDSLEHIKVFNG